MRRARPATKPASILRFTRSRPGPIRSPRRAGAVSAHRAGRRASRAPALHRDAEREGPGDDACDGERPGCLLCGEDQQQCEGADRNTRARRRSHEPARLRLHEQCAVPAGHVAEHGSERSRRRTPSTVPSARESRVGPHAGISWHQPSDPAVPVTVGLGCGRPRHLALSRQGDARRGAGIGRRSAPRQRERPAFAGLSSSRGDRI